MIEKISIGLIGIIIIFFINTLSGCKSDSNSSDPGLLNNLATTVITGGTTAEVALLNAKPTTISGNVVDDNTGSVVGGAKVTVDSYGTAYTDNNGNYSITNILLTSSDGSIPTETVLKESKNISASKTGYISDVYAIEIRNGVQLKANFRLKK